MRRNWLTALALSGARDYGSNDPTLAYYRGLKASQIPQEIAAKNMLMEKAQMELEGAKEARNILSQVPYGEIMGSPAMGQLGKAAAVSGNMKGLLQLIQTNMENMSRQKVADLDNFATDFRTGLAGVRTPDDLPAFADFIERRHPGAGKIVPKPGHYRNLDGTYNMEMFREDIRNAVAPMAMVNLEAAKQRTKGRVAVAEKGIQREIIKQEGSTEREIVKGIERRKTKKTPKGGEGGGTRDVSPVDLKNYELIKATGDPAKIDEFRRRFKEANKFDIEDAVKKKSKKKGKLSDWIEE